MIFSSMLCGWPSTSDSSEADVPADGKKQRNAAFRVGLNLRTQLLELLAEQRSHRQGQDDQVLEQLRRSYHVLRGERRQSAQLVGLCGLGQKPRYGLPSALARHRVDAAG